MSAGLLTERDGVWHSQPCLACCANEASTHISGVLVICFFSFLIESAVTLPGMEESDMLGLTERYRLGYI